MAIQEGRFREELKKQGEEEQEMSWIPQKIIQCGRVTGVTVDEANEGWTELIHFAQRREE